MSVTALDLPTRTGMTDVPWFEKLLVVAGLLVFFGAFRSLLLGGSDDRGDGSFLFQALSGSIYLASLVIVLARGIPTWVFPMLCRAWPLVLLTLLTLVSTLWSQDPFPTFRRAVALILCSWFAIYIVIRFTPRGFFNLLVIAFAIFVGVTVLAAATGEGITGGGTYAGAWRGLTGNKNDLGRGIALGIALLLPIALLRLTGFRRGALAIVVISLPVLFLSQSATSLASALAGLIVGGFLYVVFGGRVWRFRLGPELGVAMGGIALVVGLLMFTVLWTPVLELLGRDPTLTGRTKLWEWSLAQNEDRRLLGSGYRAFWIDKNTRYFFLAFAWNKGPDGERSDSFSGPTHAHSGYVDLMLELGYVGFALFLATIATAGVTLRRTLMHGDQRVGFIFAVIVSFLLVYVVTSKTILQQGEGLWVIFVIMFLFAIKEGLSLHDYKASR